MMRRLYLLRHGQSADKQPGHTDKSRELSLRGISDIGRLAVQINKLEIKFDFMISSSALRAQSTAAALALESGHRPAEICYTDDLYDASTEQLMNIIRGMNTVHHSVLLVGHNPSISEAAHQLTGGAVHELSAGTLVAIQFSDWSKAFQNSGELIQRIDPA